MGNISTFGTFTVARLGIYAAHKAIDIVGNNISNINTEGYSRQDIDQFSMNMGGADRYQSMLDSRVGSGAFVAGVTQMRDTFLDIRYRDEQASVGAMEGLLSGYEGLESILDEVGRGTDEEGVLEARFNEMIEMMQRLNTEGAGRDEFDSLFRASASALVNTIHTYATQLETEEAVQNLNFRQDVDQVNTILERIRDLNTSIRKVQVYGGNALEQQDERNLLIDELSKYMRIDITTEKEYLGEKKYVDKLVIKTAEYPQRTLISGIFATQLSIREVTDQNGNSVEDPDLSLDLEPLKDVNGRTLISTATDTVALKRADGSSIDDITEAEAEELLENTELYPAEGTDSNGNKASFTYELQQDEDGNYSVLRTATTTGAVQLGETELVGKLQSEREALTKQGVFSTAEELAKDPNAASKRGVAFYRKALDVLANTLATTLNNANVAVGPLFSNNGTDDKTDDPPIDASNISISKSWANGSFRVYTSSDRENQSTANDNLNKILNLLDGSIHKFKTTGADGKINADAASDEVFFTGSFQELFTNHMVGSLANDIRVTKTMLSNYETVAEELYVDRDAVQGVDLNDEAMNMMMYQKSYSAACRLMTVYDEMLDRLINGTAM